VWNQWRTGEGTLILLGVLGGWPGAFVAQQLFHHKTKKRSFQIAFWLTVLLHCFGFVLLLSLDVVSQFSSFRQILATDASGNQRQATATVHVQHSRQYCLGVGEQRVGIKWKAK